jgi:hypothetical protein
MRNMTWGDLALCNHDVGREMAATGCVAARIWEEDNIMLSSYLLTRKVHLFIAYSSSLGPGTCMWRELETRP